MDLDDTTYLLRNILFSVAPQQSSRNRLWVMKLTQATDTDAALSLAIAKTIVRVLSSRAIVLLVPRDAVPLFTEAQLHRLRIERLRIPGPYRYYAASRVPDCILFRQKKLRKGQPTTNAMTVVDLRTTWLELLPFEVRYINCKLAIRGASWLEHIRLLAEHDLMHIGHLEEWKKTSKKDRRTMDYCSITVFDRVLAVNLLRRNFLKLTPRAKYAFHASDAHVRKSAPSTLHHYILSVSTRNRYRIFPLRSGSGTRENCHFSVFPYNKSSQTSSDLWKITEACMACQVQRTICRTNSRLCFAPDGKTILQGAVFQ